MKIVEGIAMRLEATFLSSDGIFVSIVRVDGNVTLMLRRMKQRPAAQVRVRAAMARASIAFLS